MRKTSPMKLSEIQDKLYVNRTANITNTKNVIVFEKHNKWYLVDGWGIVLNYLSGNIGDVDIIEQHMFKFQRSEFVALNKVPHRMSDV